jgi:hypothetical protein
MLHTHLRSVLGGYAGEEQGPEIATMVVAAKTKSW